MHSTDSFNFGGYTKIFFLIRRSYYTSEQRAGEFISDVMKQNVRFLDNNMKAKCLAHLLAGNTSSIKRMTKTAIKSIDHRP